MPSSRRMIPLVGDGRQGEAMCTRLQTLWITVVNRPNGGASAARSPWCG